MATVETKKMINFSDDPSTGCFVMEPRKEGEVRTFPLEYFHRGRWNDATFVEDDEGFRWIDEATGTEYWVEERPNLNQYAHNPPWSDYGYTIKRKQNP